VVVVVVRWMQALAGCAVKAFEMDECCPAKSM
jgi:hypothetical protein